MMNAYSTYKHSGIDWLDKIPSHWSSVRAQYLFDIVSGSTPNSTDETLWDGDIRWITPADFKTEDRYISTGKRTISKKGYDTCSTTLLPAGSIIFSKRAPIGKVVIAKNELCTNQGCFGCIPSKLLSNEYFYYLMSILEPQYNLLGSGSTFMEISAKEFCSFKLLFPPLDEQEAIAAFLDEKTAKIDALTAEKQSQVEELCAYRTSLISETVTRGLNSNAPLRHSGIDWLGDIPEHWVISPLKYLVSEPLAYGANEAPQEEIDMANPRYIRITDINDTDGSLKHETYRTLELHKAQPYLLKKGDVLFARSGATVGKTYRFIEDYPCCFAGYLIRARCNESLDSEYLIYFTNSLCYTNWKNSIFNQSTIQNIAADKYNNLPIAVPTLSEQHEIVAFLKEKTSKIDKAISELEAQLEELAEYKKAVITEAVTGKVDVRDWKPKE